MAALAGGSCLVGIAIMLASSCSAKNVTVDVPIAVYVPASCGDAGGAQVTYTGLGDFSQASPAAQAVYLGTSDAALTGFPDDTREVVITPLTDAGPWAGAALVPDSGRGTVEVLALPQDRACPLSKLVNLAGDPGATIGSIDATHAMLVGGPLPPFVVDLGNGLVTQLGAQLDPPRDYATVTPFGAGALIAGGASDDGTTMGQAFDTAVVYTPGSGSSAATSGSFGSPVVLPSGQREQHGAVALADGRVLLVGGITDGNALVTAIDVLDPSNPTQPTALAATLHTGRIHPIVLALPNGEVFIGGGLAADGMTPVASVEWLAADLSWMGTQTLCSAGTEQGFAPTEGGAVLAVMGPTPPTSTCSNVHLVLPSGISELPALSPAPLRVRLFAGAQASPVLITDIATLRWNPWTTLFTSLGPNALGPSLPTSAFLAPSLGLALWLGEDDNVWVLRFDTHGPYATDFAHGPYLVTDDLYTAPDRAPGTDVSFMVQGGAVLSNGATIWVTDATFASVTVSVSLPLGGAGEVVLRDPSGHEVICSVTGVPPQGTVQVVRSGSSVQVGVGVGAAPTQACSGQLAGGVRVAVGVRGRGLSTGAGASTVQSLTVTR